MIHCETLLKKQHTVFIVHSNLELFLLKIILSRHSIMPEFALKGAGLFVQKQTGSKTCIGVYSLTYPVSLDI
ncbi:protein of unknown function [Maridesulfovibrio hydrothermalis AM13 = DSM 14728]|uniref:Uncharacterized protein n=1 Tax=Maridesulfovibrio hydrothermalis AM13 = DSM 14728 TaxID=1121451 RepID=L0R918_9BACT|nr:protein of unknown function [Maridesulfovibrio hydrothermalis AM13 = DSM 14728]